MYRQGRRIAATGRAVIAGIGACCLAVPALGQAAVPSFMGGIGELGDTFGISAQKLSYLTEEGTPKVPGKLASETLRGTGSRAGYVLSHGGVIPDSLHVSVDARTLRHGVDYYLDAANGMLAFADPVRPIQSIRVSYRFIASADGQRSPLGLQGLTLNLQGGSLSFGYGLSTDKADGLDFTTYGLDFNNSFHAGSSLSGLLYLSTPSATNANKVDDLSTSRKTGTRNVNTKDAVTDHLILQSLSLKSGAATFHATYQDVGQHFNGFQGLRASNTAKADMLAQINTLEKEKGLRRLGFGAGLELSGSGSLGMDWDQVGDEKGNLTREKLSFASRSLKVDFLDQRVGEEFASAAKLTDGEKAQVANEKGMHRALLGMSLALAKGMALTYSDLKLDSKNGGLSRSTIGFDAKGFSFKLNRGETDKSFTRAADLAMAEADKKAVEGERGYRRTDYALKLTAIKGVTLEDIQYKARDDADKLAKSSFKRTFAWALGKTTNLGYLAEGNATERSGISEDARTHDLLSFSTETRKGIKLNMYQDRVQTVAGSKAQPDVDTDFFHLEGYRTKPNNFLFETKRMRTGSAKFENITVAEVNLLPMKTLALRLNSTSVDRGKDQSAETNLLDWKWKTTPTLTLNGQVAETKTNNQQNTATQTLGVTDTIDKNFTVAATHTTVDQQQKRPTQVTDVSISNARPVKALGMKNVVMTARYAVTENDDKKQSENAGAKIQGAVGANQVGLEYSDALEPSGKALVVRAVSFTSDPSPKLPLHLDFHYKARNLNRGSLELIRKYTVALTLSKATSITYSYTSLPEDAAGNVQQTICSAFGLKQVLDKRLKLAVDYTTNKDLAQKTAASKLVAAVNDQVDKQSTVSVTYTVDIADQKADQKDSSTVAVLYDHQVDGDHFIRVATSYSWFRRGQQPDDLQANIDFKTLF